MVAWLSHGGTLIRAAPEHLRMATSLETRTYDILQEASLLNHKNMAGSKYVDLGAPPSAAEERTATHMQVDDPPMDASYDARRPRKGIQVCHLAPRIHEDPERNQTVNDPRVEPPNRRPQTHQNHHPLPHPRVNPSHSKHNQPDRQHLWRQ